MEDPNILIPKDFCLNKTKPKHAVWIAHMYPPEHNAGAELMAHVLNVFLVKKGWTVTIVIPEFPHKSYQGVHIVTFKESEKVEKVLSEASILISHLKYSTMTVKIAAQLQKHVILLMHNSFQIPYLRDFLKIVPPAYLHLIHNSNWIQRFYLRFHLDSRVLYPPIDYADFQFPVKGLYVTLINCSADKGAQVLINIAKKMPETQFLGVLGAYGDQIQDTTLPNIHYMKNTPNVRLFYQKSSIVLMPSVYESWGRVAVESMYLGIPVIAHPTNGLKESLGPAGLFADRDKPDQWVHLIRKLQKNPWLYQRKSMEGKIRASELDTQKQLKDVEEWLQKY